MAILVEAVSNMASSQLSNQRTLIDECGEATEELSEEVSLELQDEEDELKQGLPQGEEDETIEPEEVGKEEDTSPPIPLVSNEEGIELEGSHQEEEVEQEASSTIEDDSTPTNESFGIDESPSLCYEINDKEDRAQPPTHDLSNEG
ncbi:uncharacterized protein LOC130949685 [Arachis stenosperma]|uniref:uncharacterized protein LOC130949685 n=1 Tax=Arachis stenosperma TaxID=217475 RepID=UPI0025AC88F6|nr:uncharacterized protein LOC130949685 [Arachis stenosperma]